jgi:hypothetical protein
LTPAAVSEASSWRRSQRLPQSRRGRARLARESWRAWRIGIRHPRQRVLASVEITDGAIARAAITSAVSTLTAGAIAVLNPCTGMPVDSWQSVVKSDPVRLAGSCSTIAMLLENKACRSCAGKL